MHDKIKRRLLAALTGTLMGMTVGLATANPAQALVSDCTAYNNVVCFHQHANFSGQVWRQTTGQFPTGCRNLTGFNNMASTAFNRTSNYLVYLHDGANCTGPSYGLGIGDIWSAGDSNPEWNDRASSIRIRYVG